MLDLVGHLVAEECPQVALPLGRVGVEDEIKQPGILGPYRAHGGFRGTEGRSLFAVPDPELGVEGRDRGAQVLPFRSVRR